MTAAQRWVSAVVVGGLLGLAPLAASGQGGDGHRLYLTVDKSRIIHSAERITKVSVASPRIVDVVVISPQELLVNGKEVGITSLLLFHGNRYEAYDLVVYRAPVVETAVSDPASVPHSVLVQRGDKITDHVFVRDRNSAWLELGTVKPATEEGAK